MDQDLECQEPASRGLNDASALLRDHSVQSWAVRLEAGQMQLTDLNQEPAFCTPGLWVHTATLLHPPFQPAAPLARRGGVREGGSCSSRRAELQVGCRGPAGDQGPFSQRVSPAEPRGEMESLTVRRGRDKWSRACYPLLTSRGSSVVTSDGARRRGRFRFGKEKKEVTGGGVKVDQDVTFLSPTPCTALVSQKSGCDSIIITCFSIY